VLDAGPSAVGEIGLDRWIEDFDTPQQEEAFIWQLRLAAERNLPVSIHCLKAWGRLQEILQSEPRPNCGLVLHSFGGPKEMVPALTQLGAYFSFPGYFAHERKAKQREVFRAVPGDRMLIETDAPDQLLPEKLSEYLLTDSQGKALNHPANLGAVYRFAAEFLGKSIEKLAQQVEANFLRVFGKVAQTSERH
jgi:TatD DNase family protein